ncbi:hypothetical protein PIB30_027574 [Stylosanthes scabra]|uniref:Uncharacterized protein n=1 Tax=Stylosanthes scabra TaxID=79078 RepID=A0ABU6W918_9FABA|nr:hypothetical protein [Stylosanthes scabra]
MTGLLRNRCGMQCRLWSAYPVPMLSINWVRFLMANFCSGATRVSSVKAQFKEKVNEVVVNLPWVKNVKVTMSAQPARSLFCRATSSREVLKNQL